MRQVDEGERLELAEAAHVHLHLKAFTVLSIIVPLWGMPQTP